MAEGLTQGRPSHTDLRARTLIRDVQYVQGCLYQAVSKSIPFCNDVAGLFEQQLMASRWGVGLRNV